MAHQKIAVSFVLLTFCLSLITGCAGQNVSQTAEYAGTAAAQTVAAMPTFTPRATYTPTITLTPTITNTATITQTATATLTSTPAASGPTNFPANVDPLTGLVVSDPSILNRRPVMVKVSNYPAVGRPHSGLSQADIVFDYGIDNGTNRFLALFYGQDSTRVGPIRSGRYVDVDLVSMYQGILSYASAWAPELSSILGALGSRAIMEGNSNTAMYRDSSVSASETVYNLFADTAKLTQYAASRGIEQKKYNLDGMAFNEVTPSGGTNATTLAVSFGPHNEMDFRYDQASGKYLLWEDDGSGSDPNNMITLVDRNNNQQLAFSNVVVLTTTYDRVAAAVYKIPIETIYSYSKAVIFRNGQKYDALWKSLGNNTPIQFYTTDKQPFTFQPGNTWIVVGGTTGKMSQPDQSANPASWLYYFNPP